MDDAAPEALPAEPVGTEALPGDPVGTEGDISEPADGDGNDFVPLPVMPLPEVWHMEAAQLPDGAPAVKVTVSSFQGIFVHFIPREPAKKIASDMRKLADKGPGLITPPATGKLLVARG